MAVRQFETISDMRRGLWSLKMAGERLAHANAEYGEVYRGYIIALTNALEHPAFFHDYINAALDDHAVWHLHRKGKYLTLEISCDVLGYKSIPLSWTQFSIIIEELEARGHSVE